MRWSRSRSLRRWPGKLKSARLEEICSVKTWGRALHTAGSSAGKGAAVSVTRTGEAEGGRERRVTCDVRRGWAAAGERGSSWTPWASQASENVGRPLHVPELHPEGMKLSLPAAVWRTASRRADADKLWNVPWWASLGGRLASQAQGLRLQSPWWEDTTSCSRRSSLRLLKGLKAELRSYGAALVAQR